MIPQEVLTHLLVLTVGTSRGIVHAKKPDWLTNLVLPTINVSAVVTEDMIFELAPDDSINEQKTSEVDA